MSADSSTCPTCGKPWNECNCPLPARGPYEIPDEQLERHILQLAKEWNVPPEAIPFAKAHSGLRITNEILQAAGSLINAEDPNIDVELWAIARRMGLSDEEYSRITPNAFLALVKKHYPDRHSGQGSSPNESRLLEVFREDGKLTQAKIAVALVLIASTVRLSNEDICRKIGARTNPPYGDFKFWIEAYDARSGSRYLYRSKIKVLVSKVRKKLKENNIRFETGSADIQ